MGGTVFMERLDSQKAGCCHSANPEIKSKPLVWCIDRMAGRLLQKSTCCFWIDPASQGKTRWVGLIIDRGDSEKKTLRSPSDLDIEQWHHIPRCPSPGCSLGSALCKKHDWFISRVHLRSCSCHRIFCHHRFDSRKLKRCGVQRGESLFNDVFAVESKRKDEIHRTVLMIYVWCMMIWFINPW